MSNVADRFVILLDANVLYPFQVRDAILRFAEAGLFRARWSQQIIDEWTRNLIENRPHLEESIRSQEQAIAEAFPEAMVEGYEYLVPALKLPDEDDRHVLAAAIRKPCLNIRSPRSFTTASLSIGSCKPCVATGWRSIQKRVRKSRSRPPSDWSTTHFRLTK